MTKQRPLRPLFAALATVSLLAGSHPSPARADLTNIDVTYHGGPLIQHVHVFTLFWGQAWKGSSLPAYVNSFFKALFADKRFMLNLSQYSASGYKISNGSFIGTGIDDTSVPSTLSDAQIRAEIQAQVAAGTLPPIDSDALFFVFTPRNVVVTDRNGYDSVNDFAGYHDFASEASFAYSVIPSADPSGLTLAASHELAEAVTDPEPTPSSLGWYDANNGEIGDIPLSMLAAGTLSESDIVDTLTGPDGTQYAVQKVWSNFDNAPVAFAP